MKYYVGHALALAMALASAPLAAQDLIGFDRTSFGKVVLSRSESAGISTDDREFEMAVDSYNNESIQNYSSDSVFSRMGRSVGRLDILTDTGIFPCTAFIVDKKHILTNYHCVPGILDNEQAKATRIDAVQFVAGYIQQGVDEGTSTYTVSPTPVEADKDLDYAILEVIGNPSAKYGMLALSARQPRDNDPFWIIGHPMGEAQRISREKCKANSPSLSNNELLHTCDTLPGNSGSPVIDASMQRVIALHHAGSKKASVNFAIPMSLILAKSKYLVASEGTLLSGPTTGVSTSALGVSGLAENGKNICDSLYSEAKAYAACFAYRAYANSCKSHPYVGFADAFIDDNCSAPVAPVVALKPVPESETTPTPEADPTTAGEGLQICNETPEAQSVSIGYQGEDEKWTSEGWWNIDPNACATVVAGALTKRYFYYRTEVDGGPFEGGRFTFCTSPQVYTIAGDSDCEARGYESEQFAQIDTGATAKSFVFSLGVSEPSPVVATKPAPEPDATATTGEGLRFCNETAHVQAVSIGYQGEDEQWTSEGWWNLDQNKCATVMAGDLKKRYYYYRAEVDGGPFEGGGYKFCTSPNEYTIVGDTNCEERDYEREDFAEIDTGPTAKSFVFTLVEVN